MDKNKNLTFDNTFDLAVKNQLENKMEIAQKLYLEVLNKNPNHLDANNNLGIIFQKNGEHQKAISFFEKIIKINPNYINAYKNLATISQKLGNYQKAINYYVMAIKIAPNNMFLIYPLSHLLKNLSITFAKENDLQELKKIFLFLFKRNDINHKPHFNNAKFIILSQFDDDQKKIINSQIDLIKNDFIQNLLEDDLFNLLLQKTLIADEFLENLLHKIRSEVLSSLNDPNKKTLNKYSSFIISLAQQCWFNEYIYISTKKEIENIKKLKNKIETEEEIDELKIIILACFEPLNNSEIIINKLNNYKSKNDLFNTLINTQIKETLKEAEIKKSIKSLSKIVNPISQNVQKQYEENPYPRWISIERFIPQNFLIHLNNDIQPNKIEYNNKFDNPNVLIAGCGTGRHPIANSMYKDAKILAVDLSLASLAYAKRKSDELGVKNIEYLHADILQLKDLKRKFDVIESSGVLHHMDDPIAGLRVLHDILEPHGFLKLGLYSETARKEVVKGREFIKSKKFKDTNENIRICRQLFFKEQENLSLKNSIQSSDFYSLSSVRDLFFHTQEHRYTIPQISKILNDFNFEFLGFFSLHPSIKHKFSDHFPKDKKNISLENWHEFELNNPDTFLGMYQFWLKKK